MAGVDGTDVRQLDSSELLQRQDVVAAEVQCVQRREAQGRALAMQCMGDDREVVVVHGPTADGHHLRDGRLREALRLPLGLPELHLLGQRIGNANCRVRHVLTRQHKAPFGSKNLLLVAPFDLRQARHHGGTADDEARGTWASRGASQRDQARVQRMHAFPADAVFQDLPNFFGQLSPRLVRKPHLASCDHVALGSPEDRP
mmetsp:Transcript_121093/g.386718  ORF Transcript_121093/g.386718 Transcript_121093/m.386718 type:complete len:201 (-) Transcript_121093:2602-3204(-)